jgi:hypothetical protein
MKSNRSYLRNKMKRKILTIYWNRWKIDLIAIFSKMFMVVLSFELTLNWHGQCLLLSKDRHKHGTIDFYRSLFDTDSSYRSKKKIVWCFRVLEKHLSSPFLFFSFLFFSFLLLRTYQWLIDRWWHDSQIRFVS